MRLPELRTSDLRAIGRFARSLYEATDANDWEQRFHGGIRGLVDGDVSVWNEIDVQKTTILNASTWPSYDLRFWHKWVPDLLANLHEHPVMLFFRHSRPGSYVLRLSDWTDQRHIQQQPLFQDVYFRWDWQRMCIAATHAGGDRYYSFQVNRSSLDFSTRDLQRFQAISGHCQRARRNLETRDRLEQSIRALRAGADPANRFWVAVSRHLHIASESPNAKKALAAVFVSPSQTLLLPAELKERLLSGIAGWEREKTPFEDRVMRFAAGKGRCVVDFVYRQGAGGSGRLEGAMRKSADRSASSDGSALPRILTLRESETLRWLLQGKTNPEIAILLGVRPKSIEKHVTAILAKLGLERRQDLMLRFGESVP